MDPVAPELDRLEEKIHRLKREYDLFLSGQRRIEPSALRDEVNREILQYSRFPYSSTAVRYRMTMLAHRFRAVETQIRNLLDLRVSKRKEGEPSAAPPPAFVLVDRAALEHPTVIDSHLKSLYRAYAESLAGRPAPPMEALRDRLLEEARKLVARPGVRAVRFTLVQGEGSAKIRGELLSDSRPSGEDPGSP